MKPFGCALLILLWATTLQAQNSLTVTIDDVDWKPETISAGIETVMHLTGFVIIAQKGVERLVISVDYAVVKGKTSASITFKEDLMLPPGGASISYAPNGSGKQQWVSASGELVLSEFDEAAGTASGSFEGTISLMLDDNGGFVLTTPKPVKTISGKFEKVEFR